MPRILYIVPSDYDALKAKGVDGMIFDRDEEGFFERVVTVHPVAYRSRVINFNDIFALHEFGFDVFGQASRSRFFRAMISPLQFFRAVSAMRKIVYKERIDLIRANDPFWIGLMGLVVARLTGRPLCVSIHADYDKREQLTGGGDTYTLFGMRWPARLICRLVLSSADMVMPIRESLRKWAIANGSPGGIIRVIPHGVNKKSLETVEYYDYRNLLGIAPDRRIINFVGRLSPENYVADIIEMTRRLAARRSDFCLVIAGEGILEDWLKKLLAVDSKLNSMVRLAGFRSRASCFDLREQSALSICLMGGLSLIEACLAKRPVVSYDVEWHSELVVNGVTGFLVKEHDIENLVSSVNFLLEHPHEADVMGQKAEILAADKHDIKMTTGIKISCYEEILRRSKAGIMKQHKPEEQVAAGNNWYTDDQFKSQLGTPGRRRIIESRWSVFQGMIEGWMQEQRNHDSGKKLRMLDAGCGDGINLMGISEIAGKRGWNIDLTGIDYNPVRVRRASGHAGCFQVKEASLYNMPFENESFDIVLCSQVLEHIPDMARAVGELHRVLKTGGLLIASVPNEGCLMARLRNNVIQRSILRKTDHVNFFTKKSFTEKILRYGFSVRSVEDETFFFPLSYINIAMNESAAGYRIMSVLRRVFPSQAGGFISAFSKRS